MIENKSLPHDAHAGSREPAGAAHVAGAMLDSVVCFALDGKAYAIDVAVVREVVRVDKLIPVPRTPAAIVGAFALRGATVALVDTRILFGIDGGAGAPAAMALVIARGHRVLCGLTTDQVIGVVPFSEAKFTPAVRGREPPQIAGFLLDDRGGLLTVLDTSTIVHALERLRC
jgi:purine-binding chemotaxis protein CheW